jgi:hypothetical protein
MASRDRKILAAIVALCVMGGGAYVVLAALGPSRTTTSARPQLSSIPTGADLMVRAVDPTDPRLNGRVYVLSNGKLKREAGGDLTCERLYFAAGKGICMGVAPSGVEYTAKVFDSRFRTLHTITLTGLPSRARVSADGRYGAMTVFVAGDAYLGNSGAFSTRTYIIDMATGKELAQLEQFHVTKDGQRFDAVDFNFWGVTFDPQHSNRFYATLATGDHHYLIEGGVREHSMRVLRDGVECPSLSPNGKQIAYKSRVGTENRWRLRVLDVATLHGHGLAEKRSIDDQVEWLNDRTLAYSEGRNVYTVPADGGGHPRILVRAATSPVRLDGGGGQVSTHFPR